MRHLHGAMGHAESATAPETEGRLIGWARHYDMFVNIFTLGQMRAVRSKTVDLGGIRSGDRVLDVGCGTGDLTLAAAARASAQGEVVGIDASPEMIQVARQKAGRHGAAARFDVAVIERIPFSDNYFDVVLSSLMLHHLPGDLKQRGLAEVLRVLKPGGRLLVVDVSSHPTGIAKGVMALSGHSHSQRQAGDLQALLVQAGFADVIIGSFALGLLDYASGAKNA